MRQLRLSPTWKPEACDVARSVVPAGGYARASRPGRPLVGVAAPLLRPARSGCDLTPAPERTRLALPRSCGRTGGRYADPQLGGAAADRPRRRTRVCGG